LQREEKKFQDGFVESKGTLNVAQGKGGGAGDVRRKKKGRHLLRVTLGGVKKCRE